MPVDVRVRRCTLTIRRRDGWSWGPSPAPHIDAALASIEAALESALVEAGVEASIDAQLEETVRVEIGADGVATIASWKALVERLRALAEPAAIPPIPAPPGDAPGAVGAPPRAQSAVEPDGATLARTLARWSRGGQMWRVVAAWPEQVLREWLAAVARAAGTGAPAAPAPGATRAIVDALLGGAQPAPPGSRTEAERLLVVIAALTAALGERLPDAATQLAARAIVAPSGSEQEAFAAAADRDAEPPESKAAPTEAPAGERLVLALPLLVLAQLARIGYADAMEAAARAAGLPGAAPLAAALAGKLLPAPSRGWRREPTELAAIALASAGHAGTDWAEEVARRADALVPPLASALIAAYAEGRSSNDEVLVTATGEGVVVGEEQGLLPIAWVAARDGLDQALDALGRPPVRRTEGFKPLAQALGECPALPRAVAPALERHLGAAAGTGLGLLALDLWGEDATALDALERLADLEARAELTPGGLVLGIPRGRRWLDLQRGGMLERFTIPWLPGRRMEVGTW
jgi:hypothetical protein